MIEAGGADYMDAVSWHPYAQWNSEDKYSHHYEVPEIFLPGWLDTFKGLVPENKAIWTTEQGWNTQYGVPENQVAKYLPRSYAIEMAHGVEKYFWYEFINENGSDGIGWGVLRSGDYKTRWAAKPSFLALSAMNAKLAGTEFEAATEKNGFIKYDFVNKDSEKISMIWCEEGEVLQTVDFGETSMLKTDIYGNEELLHSDTGIYEIKATDEPAYYEAFFEKETDFGYDYDINSGLCSIHGYIKSGAANVPVNLVLYKPDMSYLDAVPEDATNAISHINQILTDEEGYFTFEFIPDGPEGIYHLSLSSMDGDVQNYNLRLMSDLYAEVSIKDKNISEVKEGDSFTCNVEVIGTNPITKVYDVYIALYQNKKLVNVYAKKDEVMNNSYTKLTHVDIENAPAFDEIKAFVLEQELKPVVSSAKIMKSE